MSFELTKLEKTEGEIRSLKPRVDALFEAASAVVIRSVSGAEVATNVLGQIQERKRSDEATRKLLVKPLQDHVRFINDGFKPLAGALAEAEALVKKKLLDWNREEDARVERIRLAAMRERERIDRETEAKAEAAGMRTVAEALDAGFSNQEANELADLEADAVIDAAPPPPPVVVEPPPAKTISTGVARATVRKVWTFEVLDKLKVPRAFLTVDRGAIRIAVRAGWREIAGVRIYQEESISGGR